jgi:hypothetical protein
MLQIVRGLRIANSIVQFPALFGLVSCISP